MYQLVQSIRHSIHPEKVTRYVRVSAMTVKFIIKNRLDNIIIASKYKDVYDMRRFEFNKKYQRRKFDSWESLNLITMSAFNSPSMFWWMNFDILEKLQKEFPILKQK